MPLVQEKIGALGEFEDFAGFLFHPVVYERRGVADGWPACPRRRPILDGAAAALEAIAGDLDVADVDAALRGVVETLGLKPRVAFLPPRVAITGRTVSPGPVRVDRAARPRGVRWERLRGALAHLERAIGRGFRRLTRSSRSKPHESESPFCGTRPGCIEWIPVATYSDTSIPFDDDLEIEIEHDLPRGPRAGTLGRSITTGLALILAVALAAGAAAMAYTVGKARDGRTRDQGRRRQDRRAGPGRRRSRPARRPGYAAGFNAGVVKGTNAGSLRVVQPRFQAREEDRLRRGRARRPPPRASPTAPTRSRSSTRR